MDEKIKITMPKSLIELLKKDCIDFKIQKENGAPNFNSFLNTLVANFYEEFSRDDETFHDEIRKAISIVPDYYKEKVFLDLIKTLNKPQPLEEKDKKSGIVSFKPTKQTEKIVLYIQTILLKNESLSSYYRRLFSLYASKTKNEREKIIYKENYALLIHATKKSLLACVQLTSNEIIPSCSIFSVCPSKDELFNYVLLYNGTHNITLRLASIRSVSLLSKKAEIPEKNQEYFTRQIACGAQYPIYNTDDEPIIVQLTEKGKKLFNKIYLYRPIPISIEGDIYTFNCSANQVLYYFERFGESALILSPKRIGVFMRNYYYFAYKKYKKIYKD